MTWAAKYKRGLEGAEGSLIPKVSVLDCSYVKNFSFEQSEECSVVKFSSLSKGREGLENR